MSKGKGNYFQLPSFNATMTENVPQYTITHCLTEIVTVLQSYLYCPTVTLR